MTIIQIENNLKELVKNISMDTFVFDLLLAYGFNKSTLKRLEVGELNQLDSKGELLSRKNLFFKVTTSNELHSVIDSLQAENKTTKKPPRFIIVTDYETLLAADTKTEDTLDIKLLDIIKHYDFFLPWAGMERAQYIDENPADVKAAEKMAKLYDAIVKDNEIETKEDVHALNVFLTRLLFCYFAEDTNIFFDNQFTNAIKSHTQENGSDLHSYLDRLFDVLNIAKRDEALPEYLKEFPYVNGGLFRDKFSLPKFTRKSRNIMIEVGELNWSEINPDIFGSMIQAVITPDHRGGMGMHYTSVPNIMKVIEPLFLDELQQELEKSKSSKVKLVELHKRLTSLKIFDPACGSGNFLIIAYKEIRKLEIQIYKAINALNRTPQFFYPEIKLSQFFGIELDDFAHEVATLSLWLAEHQMNLEFFQEFGRTSPTLPLNESGNIVHGNATGLHWEEVCPKTSEGETYLLGNPPYQGSGKQNKGQKDDMAIVFHDIASYKKLDYISCWFYLGAKYIIGSNAKVAFVTTNSLSQGEQVGLLWPIIFNLKVEIFFAYESFKWKNNAKDNAGVSVTNIGLRNLSDEPKYIFRDSIKQTVKNINAYLVDSNNVFVQASKKSKSNLPEMIKGSAPTDDGHLILSESEKNEIIKSNPNSRAFIKKYIGAKDFMNDNHRYCIWITEEQKDEAVALESLKDRFDKVAQFRSKSKKLATKKKANTPYFFDEQKYSNLESIVIPQTGSERREYLPVDIVDSNTVVSNGLRIIYSPELYIFGILSTRMHMVWVKAVAGRMKTDMQYSNTICYNTFPFPKIVKKQKEDIAEYTVDILKERGLNAGKTLAQLYDPDKMPEGLKEAHYQLDLTVERCYRTKPFVNDEERLEHLFKLYEKMIENESK